MAIRKSNPALDRATAEVISIVRELLEVEEQLGPLVQRKTDLEAALGTWIDPSAVGEVRVAGRPVPQLGQPVAAALAEVPSFSRATGPEPDLIVGPPNRMVQKRNPMTCPFGGCNYEALSEIDLADHMAGCQPDDAG